MDFAIVAGGWRTGLALGVLIGLLAWETSRPYFRFFGDASERIRHGALNLGLGALNIAVTALIFATAWLAVTQWAAAHQFGVLNLVSFSNAAHVACAVVLLDGWTYAWHRLNHRVPFFWRFHRLHHADRAMDVTTASRFHSGEIVLSSLLRLPVLLLLGCTIGELALYEALLFAVVQFHHANVALPVGVDRWLRLLIVTPAMHKVHHSVNRAEHDSNFSSLFSWWDRLFRTLRLLPDPRRIVFGLD